MEFMMNWRWLIATVIVFGGIAITTAIVRWRDRRFMAAALNASTGGGGGTGGTGGGAQPPTKRKWRDVLQVKDTPLRINFGLIVTVFIVAYLCGWGISEWWQVKRWAFFSLIFASFVTIGLMTLFLSSFYVTTSKFRKRGLFNLFTGHLEITGAGTKIKIPWQEPRFEADTELVTERFEEVYLTGDGAPVVATIIFSYRPSTDPVRTEVYFAQDPSRIKLSFKGVVSNTVKREINKRKLDKLLEEQTEIDTELAKIGKGHKEVTEYETEFGVDFSIIKVENLKPTEVSQEVLTRRFQTRNLAIGIDEILVKFPTIKEKITLEELFVFLEQVQINAGNIKKGVETKELRFPPELLAIGAALLEKFGHDLGPAVTAYLAARKKGH